MKIVKEQLLYFTHVKHMDTIGSAFIWWIKRKNNKCKSFCPLCKFYYRCQEDVAILNSMEAK